jgi:hypothetical protein
MAEQPLVQPGQTPLVDPDESPGLEPLPPVLDPMIDRPQTDPQAPQPQGPS